MLRLLISVTAGLISWTVGLAPASALSITGPLSASVVSGFNGSGAAYGPPAPANFTEPGPITVQSGVATNLLAGETKTASVSDSILLVLSAPASSVASLGSVTLQFGTLAAITFKASDFVSSQSDDFPSSISGIANGAVGPDGITFPSSLHAVADISLGYDISPHYATGDVIGAVKVTSSIDLRVDVFGEAAGRITGNAPNSGALFVEGGSVSVVNTPEPTSLAVLGAGLIGLAAVRRRWVSRSSP